MTCTFALTFHLIRLTVVDDIIEPGSLHLLRLVPLAWIAEEQDTRFEKMATEFGPVTLRFKLEEKGRVLSVQIEPDFSVKPERVILHVPPIEGLSTVKVNSREYAAASVDMIELEC
jgi:hypothetical protein